MRFRSAHVYKYYFLLPALYCLVFAVLLAGYISAQKKTRLAWGELSVSFENAAMRGRAAASGIPASGIAVQKADVRIGSTRFLFAGLRTVRAAGKALPLRAVMPLSSGDGFSLLFSEAPFEAPDPAALASSGGAQSVTVKNGSLLLTFQSNKIFQDEITLTVSSGRGTEALIPFKMPFTARPVDQFSQSAQSVQAAQAPQPQQTSAGGLGVIRAFSLMRARGVYVLRVLGTGSFVRYGSGYAVRTDAAHSVVRYGLKIDGGFAAVGRVPTIPDTVRAEAQKITAQFIDKAYQGWVDTRYDDVSGSYLQPEGVYGFSEAALAASFAEASRRREFVRRKLSFERTAYLHDQARTWLTAPVRFEGSQTLSRYVEQAREKEAAVLEAVAAKNYAALLDMRLASVAQVFFGDDAKRSLLNFVNGMPLWAITTEIAVALLWQAKENLWPEFSAAVASQQPVLEQIILDNITVANNGYLLRRDQGELTVFFSVLAGRYFARYGETNALKNLGNRMVVTALQLSDAQGFLPRLYAFKNGSTIPTGYLTPEELYPWLTDNPYYPRMRRATSAEAVSIFPRDDQNSDESENSSAEQTANGAAAPAQNEASVTVLAASPISIDVRSNRIDIDVQVVVPDITQYAFVLQSPPPQSIYAFDTVWSGRYFIDAVSQGVYYDGVQNIAVAKISSKNKTERISLLY